MSKLNKQLTKFVLAMMLLLSGRPTSATIIFSDNFDNGDVSDWVKTTNYGGSSAVTVRSDSFVSPDFSLFTYLDAPPGGISLFVHASHDFVAPLTTDYTLDFWGRSSPCSGCTISYDVLVDGVLLDRKFAPTAFEQRSFALNGLSAGTHLLSLGIFTTNASSGRFSASFDNVVISTTSTTIPEPSALLLYGLGFLGLIGYSWRKRRQTASSL